MQFPRGVRGNRGRPIRNLFPRDSPQRFGCAENPAYQGELFGPVAAAIHRVSSEAEAVAVANDSVFGLGAYVFTTDSDQALRVADRLEAGMVFLNEVGVESPELPFGGVKRSGFGRELGRYGVEEFANRKLIRTIS